MGTQRHPVDYADRVTLLGYFNPDPPEELAR